MNLSSPLLPISPYRLLDSREAMLDDLLLRICQKLQLTDTQYALAEDRYLTIAVWLSGNGSPLAHLLPAIYPQGSLRIGTTVKPKGRTEFDVDLVCEFGVDLRQMYTPTQLLDLVEDRLRANGLYRDMTERMGRCIRLNYANEFHMDILPAFPDPGGRSGAIVIPDEDIDRWNMSNPKGYAWWFDGRAELYALRSFKSIDELPDAESAEMKSPLQRMVQLAKRARDIAFTDNDQLDADRLPASIVITTLAAELYTGTASVTMGFGEFLTNLVQRITQNPQRLRVMNPVNDNEEFSELWSSDSRAYYQFVEWITSLNLHWQNLHSLHGIDQIAYALQHLFGESVTSAAVSDQAKFMEQLRTERRLHHDGKAARITVGTSNTKSSIPTNTFFGK